MTYDSWPTGGGLCVYRLTASPPDIPHHVAPRIPKPAPPPAPPPPCPLPLLLYQVTLPVNPPPCTLPLAPLNPPPCTLPLLCQVTLPLERMASRVAASLAYATGLGQEMVVKDHAGACVCACRGGGSWQHAV